MQKKSKRRREAKRRKWLKLHAPPDPRDALTMLIYHGGVETTVIWKTEQHYRAMAIFLKKMLGESADRLREPGKPEFYYIETGQQWDALCDFAERLSRMLEQAQGGSALA